MKTILQNFIPWNPVSDTTDLTNGFKKAISEKKKKETPNVMILCSLPLVTLK